MPRLCTILLIWKSNHKDKMKFLGAKTLIFASIYKGCTKCLWTMVFLSFLLDYFLNYLMQDYLLEEFKSKHVDFEWFNFKNGGKLLNKRFVEGCMHVPRLKCYNLWNKDFIFRCLNFYKSNSLTRYNFTVMTIKQMTSFLPYRWSNLDDKMKFWEDTASKYHMKHHMRKP